MARQKSTLHTRSKSVTVEGASVTQMDDEANQEMHEASTQGPSTQGQLFFFFFLLGSDCLERYLFAASLYCM